MPTGQPIVHVVDFADTNNHDLSAALATDDFEVIAYKYEQAVFNLPADAHPDLILLCLTSDEGGGLACCRDFRSAYPECGICLVHEGLSEWEESIALELGVDVVVHRPSESRRILAQVRALLRRQVGQRSPRLQMLAGSRMVKVNSQSIPLTDAEYELLSILAGQPGTVVSRDAISRHLRGLDYDARDRTIDLRIARIRHKLGDNARHPLFIRTVRGEGYMLMVDDT